MAPLPSGHLGSHGSLPGSMTTEDEDYVNDNAVTSDAFATGEEEFAEGVTIGDHFDEGVCPFCPDEDVIGPDGEVIEEAEDEDYRTFDTRQGAMTHARQRHEAEYEAWKAQRDEGE